MAKYLILIYGDERRWDEMSAREGEQIGEGHRAFRAKAGDAVLAAGELEPSATATSLRAGAGAENGSGSGGRPSITDGPFLETKEAIGGFYVIEAANLDEAISLASGLAEVAHDHSGVEIRPLANSD